MPIYVGEESLRVQKACSLLQKNNILGFGEEMFNSHQGLSRLYEVSCMELDILASLARNESSVAGARMMGSGFGGCTINLIKEDAIDFVYDKFSQHYKAVTGMDLKMYVTTPQNGTERLGDGSTSG